MAGQLTGADGIELAELTAMGGVGIVDGLAGSFGLPSGPAMVRECGSARLCLGKLAKMGMDEQGQIENSITR